MLMRHAAATALIAGAMLAGCMDDDRELSAASVEFDGTGDGQEAEAARCDSGAATLSGGGRATQGSLSVEVADASGEVLFTKQYDDEWDFDGKNLDGAEGDWTLRADRSSGFDGEYGFTLTCT